MYLSAAAAVTSALPLLPLLPLLPPSILLSAFVHAQVVVCNVDQQQASWRTHRDDCLPLLLPPLLLLLLLLQLLL